MKKNKKKGIVRNWHYDFRDVSSLPDRKVVRTGFLINIIAVSLVLVLASVVGYREYSAAALESEKLSLKDELAARASQHRNIKREAAKFTQLLNGLADVEAFMSIPFDVTDLLQVISDLHSEANMLDQISFEGRELREKRTKRYVYYLTLRGGMLDSTDVSALKRITDYKNALAESTLIEPYLDDVELSFKRDENIDGFTYTIILALDMALGEGKGK